MQITSTLPRTHSELFERTLDRRGRPAGREPLPRTMAEIHRRALAATTRKTGATESGS